MMSAQRLIAAIVSATAATAAFDAAAQGDASQLDELINSPNSAAAASQSEALAPESTPSLAAAAATATCGGSISLGCLVAAAGTITAVVAAPVSGGSSPDSTAFVWIVAVLIQVGIVGEAVRILRRRTPPTSHTE